MSDAALKKEWQTLLGGLIGEPRSLKSVSALDQLTSQMHGAGILTFDEFLGAQHAITAARQVATNLQGMAK